MTTAHRPTWKAAVGQANEGGWAAGGAVSHQTSALDAPGHTRLKVRHSHQSVLGENKKQALLQQSLLALEEAETNAAAAAKTKIGKRPIDHAVEERGQQRLLKQTAEIDVEKIKKKYDDSDVDNGGDSSSESDLDANDDDDSDLDDNTSSDDDDEQDDVAALQAELAKIRAEREDAKRKEEAKAAAAENAAAEEAAVLGNPLLLHTQNSSSTADTSSGRMKRKWNDDVVFRNQAKNEPVPKKRFINDTVRNDFHKRFLNKFMR